MGRIIVDFDDSIEPWTALQAVKEITKDGRLSYARGVLKYCHASVFNHIGIVVIARDRRHEKAADSFIVQPK